MIWPAGLDRHLEVGRAGHAVELVQVVRHHAQVDQSLAQRGLGFDRIVHAARAARPDSTARCRRRSTWQAPRRPARRARSHDWRARRRSASAACRGAFRPIRRSRARESRSAAACEFAAGAGAELPPARSTSSASVASTSVSGSPPLRITSCSDVVGRDFVERRLPVGERARRFVVRKMPAEAVAAMDGARAGRDQQHAAVSTFAAARRAAWRPRRRPGRRRNRARRAISSASGSTCRSSGSAGSPGRIRATNPRGTNSGNCRAAARPPRRIPPANPAAGTIRPRSRTASFIASCHEAYRGTAIWGGQPAVRRG